jgi:hypothetical protein
MGAEATPKSGAGTTTKRPGSSPLSLASAHLTLVAWQGKRWSSGLAQAMFNGETQLGTKGGQWVLVVPVSVKEAVDTNSQA